MFPFFPNEIDSFIALSISNFVSNVVWLISVSKSLYFNFILCSFFLLYISSNFDFVSSLESPEMSIPSTFKPIIILLLFIFKRAKITEKIIINTINIDIANILFLILLFTLFFSFIVGLPFT